MGDNGNGPNRIMVFLRIRPPKKGELNEAEGIGHLMEILPGNKGVQLEGGKRYDFDGVFNVGDVDEQASIYQAVAVPVIQNVFKGFWGTMMVYGQTGTGKSFTMCNFDPRCEGIIPRTLRGIFDIIESDSSRKYTVLFSFIQIYLDKLQDLFNPEGPELKINKDDAGVSFPGMVEHEVRDAEHFKQLYEEGNQYRVITATKMNPESSRGHAALFIQIKSCDPNDDAGEKRNGKLFLIDLAGYERFSKTGVQEGLMKEEAKTINASLLSLGNCVQALSEKSSHVPWRNAKLTRMLQDAIGGKSKCSIILTAGPSSEHVHETTGTLYFGSRAMAVKTDAKLAVKIDYQKLAMKLQEMLNLAESKISTLEMQVAMRKEESETTMANEMQSLQQRQQQALDELQKSGATDMDIEKAKKMNELEMDELKEQQTQQRVILEEETKKELAEAQNEEQIRESREAHGEDLELQCDKLKRELKAERAEKEDYKTKAREADNEARQLAIQLNDLKLQADQNPVVAQAIAAGGDAAAAVEQLRKDYESKVKTLRDTVEETAQLKMEEVRQELQEEADKYKQMYEELHGKSEKDTTVMSDQLVAKYEAEIAQIRKTSLEVQERLKANHNTIKLSYQRQRQELADENVTLMKHVAELEEKVEKGGAGAPAGGTGAPDKGPSKAELMLQRKMEEKKVAELTEKLDDMRNELNYVNTEKDTLKQQLKDYQPTGDEVAMKPLQVRKLKEDYEELQKEKQQLELQVLQLKAAQAMSGPQDVDADGEQVFIDDEAVSEGKEEILGAYEGMQAWLEKTLKNPFNPGFATNAPLSYSVVSSTLSNDLDEYRKALSAKVFLLGESMSGKSSFARCLLNPPPMIKSLPDVVSPTVHPMVYPPTAVDDPSNTKLEWYNKFGQLDNHMPEKVTKRPGLLSFLGGGSSVDTAKQYVDVIDMPGSESFWNSFPGALLPSKNAVYCIVYRMTQSFEDVRSFLERTLGDLHSRLASCKPSHVPEQTAFCLIATHSDARRTPQNQQQFLNKVTAMLGEVLRKLQGAANYGLICVGNFAVSNKDWSITNFKTRGISSFKDLLSYFGAITSYFYSNRPTNFVEETASRSMTHAYMFGGDFDDSVGADEAPRTLEGPLRRQLQGVITIVTALAREAKYKWCMEERKLRKLLEEHLQVSSATRSGMNVINNVIRELIERGFLTCVPFHFQQKQYTYKSEEELKEGQQQVSRPDGLFILEASRLLNIYSSFLSPIVVKQHGGAGQLKEKANIQYDPQMLSKMQPTWSSGYMSEEVGGLVLGRPAVHHFGRNVKLAYEFLNIMGLSIGVRQEVAVVSPAHFTSRMSDDMIAYTSYLLGCFGDGQGRKYTFDHLPPALFHRLQLKLMPFSHGPTKDQAALSTNWEDASYLILEKARLKWGVLGSFGFKEAVAKSEVQLRGVIKMEGRNLYVAITGPSSRAVQPVIAALHNELASICAREFRGVRVSFQEMVMTDAVQKRLELPSGVETLITRGGLSADVVKQQLELIGNFSKPAGMDQALASLPAEFRDQQ